LTVTPQSFSEMNLQFSSVTLARTGCRPVPREMCALLNVTLPS